MEHTVLRFGPTSRLWTASENGLGSEHTARATPQPLIAVRDVRASSGWYAELLAAEALAEHPHRDVYDRIVQDGTVVLQLHAWDVEDHPSLMNRDEARIGHGVVLWFEVGDFDAAVARAERLGAKFIQGPFVNAAPHHRELWLHDPDGFVVAVASADGEAADS